MEVSLPEGSKTTSLRGGYLQECTLFLYDTAHHVVANNTHPDQLLKGEKLRQGQGRVAGRFRRRRPGGPAETRPHLGGALCDKDRPFYLVLTGEQQYARAAMHVAERVNEVFQGQTQGTSEPIAKAMNKTLVCLRVPEQYKLNQPRFPARGAFDAAAGTAAGEQSLSQAPRRRHPRSGPHDHRGPAAGMLGTDTISILKRGLKSEHVLVRFSCAESLTYLGSPSGAEELARIVKQQPPLRAYALTARRRSTRPSVMGNCRN